MENYIALQDNKSDICGAVLFWRLNGQAEHNNIEREWNNQGLNTSWMIPETSPLVALKQAMIEVSGSRRNLVRPLGGRTGFALIQETPLGNRDLTHRTDLVVKLDKYVLQFDRSHMLSLKIKEAYETKLQEISSAAYGSWLAKLMRACHAVPLRDGGGVYFAPKNSMHKIKQVMAVTKAATEHVIHDIPSMRSDEAVAAILDSVTAEAERRMAELNETEDLGERALKTKERECESLRVTLKAYREILGPAIDRIEETLTATKANITEAILLAA